MAKEAVSSPDDLLTIEEAAIVAEVSVRTIIYWIKIGKVPAYYFGPTTATVH